MKGALLEYAEQSPEDGDGEQNLTSSGARQKAAYISIARESEEDLLILRPGRRPGGGSRQRADVRRAPEASYAHALQSTFSELRDEWLRFSLLEPSLQRKVMHPAYQRIIGLGPSAVPLILRELHREPNHWFWALRALTGIDAAQGTEGVREAADRWLRWGEEHGYL